MPVTTEQGHTDWLANLGTKTAARVRSSLSAVSFSELYGSVLPPGKGGSVQRHSRNRGKGIMPVQRWRLLHTCY